MPSYFIPPTAPLRVMTVNPAHPGHDLFRHFRPMDAAVNVYLMPGGVLTTVEPERESDAVRVFHGGHIHPVDDATTGLLIAAGYTVSVMPAPVQDGPLPGGDYDGTALANGSYGYGHYGEGAYGGTTALPGGDYSSDIDSGFYTAAYEETYT